MSFIFHYLTVNPEAQEKIFEETKDMPDELTHEDLCKAFYTRAAIHEAFRLSPVAFALARILEEDFYLSGYHLKPGVNLLIDRNLLINFRILFSSSFSRPLFSAKI